MLTCCSSMIHSNEVACQDTIVCAVCSIEEVLHHIDTSIQYGEDADVKIRDFDNQEDD